MIYIILPVHNRKNITEKFVHCLKKQTISNFRLILIDDGSTDGTDQMVLNELPNSKVIYGDGNLWWAGSLQKGYEWLLKNDCNDDDIVLLINDDTEFNEFFLQKGKELISSNKNSIVKSWSIDKYSEVREDGYIYADTNKIVFEQTEYFEKCNCSSTRGLFVKFQDFKIIGGFYPNLLPHYLSDYEFTIRAVRKGLKIICDDSLVLYSDSKQTGIHGISYSNFKEFKEQYFSFRNADNPIHRINFVKLTSNNWIIKQLNILRLRLSIIKQVLKALIFKKSI